MTIAFDADLGLNFVRGMFATVNPCGFVLLPTYLVYFLGGEAAAGGTRRASVRRALFVGAAVSAGFMAVFVAVGLVGGSLHSTLVDWSQYVTPVLGAVFIVVGTAMLAGYKPAFFRPRVEVKISDRGVRTMFGYGLAYAVASLGCTISLFLPALSSPRGGVVTDVVNVAMYSLGMGLIVVALTVSLAVANGALLRVLRRTMQYVDLLAAAFMVLSGLYLVWYFVVVDVNEDSDTVTASVQRWGDRVRAELQDHWQAIAATLVIVVVCAVAYARRRSGDQAPSTNPAASDPADGAAVASAPHDHAAAESS